MYPNKKILFILLSLLISESKCLNIQKAETLYKNSRLTNSPLCQCQDFRLNCDSTTICLKDCTNSVRKVSELDCVFPFKYKGNWYDTCTDADSPGKYWCSVTEQFSQKKASCAEKCPLLAKNLLNSGETHSNCREQGVGWRSFYPSDSEIKTVLDLHNYERSIVSPQASDMKELFWDLGLARLAMNLAATGIFDHDCSNCRKLPNKKTISNGQNLWASYGASYNNESTWSGAVMAWINEKKDFEYGTGSINGKVVGHFTQVISSRAIKIGCGGAINACNYAVGQTSVKNPYTLGSPCSNCDKCVSGSLCSCNKLCQNGGVLDLSSCSCKCPAYASGNECEILNCDKTDVEYGCQALNQPDWCKFSNIKPLCPHMCGLCLI